MTGDIAIPRRRPRRFWPVHGVVANITFGILLAYVVVGVLALIWTPFPPNANTGVLNGAPSAAHWLGTDGNGRDQLSRIMAATGPALLAAIESVLFAGVIGVLIGVVAGYLGGFWDGLLSRFMDLLFSFPEYLLAILVVTILGNGLSNVAIAIGIICVPRFARVARNATKEILSRGYVEAAVLARRSRWWIMGRHVLPNIAPPLIVMTAITLSTAEGAYAALSFLGFGERPPAADFGSMIAAAQARLIFDPLPVLFPSIVFVLLVVAFNLLGDVLQAHLDPRGAASLARSARRAASAAHRTATVSIAVDRRVS